ncbi:hypothetical protein FFLO_01697 [Filobasidium floriforme]|uniref:Mitochondrial import inner membrane translocase subunit TIM50 n=1 Tax=Filobasidium floriforme TaxID=5210 RepID=A0A8K0JP52_9TREE|nr:mitochondrial import inner membrane translocase subunit TIM50 [Filobasidium floriforme]KAG7562868.1 hypothetical protein FFLO_01697 [Filobasidium floriforme]KAH8086443.1 mitochondrial import inner membrane translocase subunit TIM50 [Filobasidium floriforme]
MFRNALAVAVRPTTTTARTTLRARRNLDSTTRAVSSTPTAFAKVGSSKTRSGVKKSMAERPSDVPDDINAPGEAKPLLTEQTFEPIVNDMRTSEGPHSTSSTPPTTATSEVPSSSSSSTTSTPPNQIPEEPYQIPDRPDLTKLPSLDFGLEEPVKEAPKIESPSGSQDGPSGSRTGARAKPSLSSIEQRRRNFTRFMLLGGLAGSGVGAYYLATKDDETKFGEAEAIGAWEKFKNNFTGLLDTFNKPAFEKLLPDPLPAPHQRSYTLLVDLEDMLVHSAWDRQGGWRTAKRPGADYFLAYLSQFYEVVLFTSQPLYTALPVADKLDPFQAYLPYKLFRESTRYIKGKVVKDLSYLNRDLSKVVLLDTNPDHASLQPENAIIIPKWDGTPGDKGLVDMIPFLESIGIFAPPDVRPILKAYEGKNIPVEYAKREAERKQAAIEEWERDHGGAGRGAGAGWLGRALGGLSGQQSVAKPTQPMTYLEQKRAQAQAMYREEQEYWRKNADEIKRLMEEDRQKQLADQKGTLMSWMTGKPSPDAQAPGQPSA